MELSSTLTIETLLFSVLPATAVVIKANCSNDRQIMGKVSGIEYKRLTEG